MTQYAIGDIQGCYDPLARLLDKVNFDVAKDTLYCVGDLVNRGPDSLKVINLLKSLNNQCVTVLGNHDIHLLSMLYGVRKHRHADTLSEILNDSAASDVADWLRQQPLMVTNEKKKFIMVHAGVYPWWTPDEAALRARDVEKCFRDEEKCVKLLKRIYSNDPSKWSDDLSKMKRRRFTINAFTRMRFVSPKGHLNFSESGFKGKLRKNRVPWFNVPNKSMKSYRVIFGHWSALGLLDTPSHLCLDTGFVWGKHMTMAKISKNNANKKTKLIIAPATTLNKQKKKV